MYGNDAPSAFDGLSHGRLHRGLVRRGVPQIAAEFIVLQIRKLKILARGPCNIDVEGFRMGCGIPQGNKWPQLFCLCLYECLADLWDWCQKNSFGYAFDSGYRMPWLFFSDNVFMLETTQPRVEYLQAQIRKSLQNLGWSLPQDRTVALATYKLPDDKCQKQQVTAVGHAVTSTGGHMQTSGRNAMRRALALPFGEISCSASTR